MRNFRVFLVFVSFLAVSGGRPATGESAAMDREGSGPGVSSGGRAKIAAVPIPSYNESFGWSLGLATSAFYRIDGADTLSPESMTALFGLYAENRTWAAGVYQRFHIDEDRWRLEFGGGYGRINFQTFVSLPGWLNDGAFMGYASEMTFAAAKGSRLAWERLYLGVRYRYMRSQTEFDVDLPIEQETGTSLFSGLGVTATWDSRDNIFYPLRGCYADFGSLWNRGWIGSDRNYAIYELSASGYREIRRGSVIAARLHSRVATGDVPFEDQSVFSSIDMRGYTDGRYRADQGHTLQAEYRWNFRSRFFAASFGGIGWSVDELSGITWYDLLPSAGLGVRWRMISDPPVGIGVHYAWGKDGGAFYFRIGEAF
jgi:outer membrane protein assembly factor BamA